MAKYLLLLMFLILPEISNAQYCTYTPTTAGYISNLQCYGISAAQALQQDWCPYKPQDPICAPYEQPTCQSTTQTQVLSCPSGQTGQITQSSTSSCPNPRGVAVPGPWITTSNSCQTVWQTQTQTLSCPANYSGAITQTRQATTSGQTTAWQTVSNTCVPNPPTCQVSTQSQTLSCPTGYVGSIQQTRSSTCPDPYGQPVWLPWATTINSCKQATTNPNNPASPISPLSQTSTPTLPSSTTAASPSTPQSTMMQQSQSVDAQPSGGQASSSAPTAATPQTSTAPAPKGKLSVGGLGVALSATVLEKPGIKQYNPFPPESMSQPMPPEMLMQSQVMMDMLYVAPIEQKQLQEDLDLTQ